MQLEEQKNKQLNICFETEETEAAGLDELEVSWNKSLQLKSHLEC